MDVHPHTWLIGFVKPSPIVLMSIPCMTLLIIHSKTKSIHRTSIYLALLFAGLCAYLKYANKAPSMIKYIPCNNGSVTMLYNNKNLALIDPGVIGQRPSASSWVQYTLIPDIIKTTGKNCIDHLILLQLNKTLFEAVATLCTKITVKNIYLISWDGELLKHEKYSFAIFMRAIKDNNSTMHRIVHKVMTLDLTGNDCITIAPLQHRINNKHIRYQAINVTGNIGNQSFELFSQKYKQPKNKTA